MKTNIACSLFLICFVIWAGSCTKQSTGTFNPQPQADQFIDVSVASGQSYTYTAGPAGILTITQQAAHYQYSQTAQAANGSIAYTYNSTPGYIGMDKVTLAYDPAKTSEVAGGCPSHAVSDAGSTTIVIRLNVTSK